MHIAGKQIDTFYKKRELVFFIRVQKLPCCVFTKASIWESIFKQNSNIIPVRLSIWGCVVSVLSFQWAGRLKFDSRLR
jgi:hypothetical protein